MIRGASIIMLLWAFCFTIQGSLGQYYTSSYYRYPYASYYGGGSYPSYNYQNYNGISGNGGYYNPGRYYNNYNQWNPIGGLNNFGSNGFLQSVGSPFGGNFGGGGYYRKK